MPSVLVGAVVVVEVGPKIRWYIESDTAARLRSRHR